MPLIRPITHLQKIDELSDFCHAHREPVFIVRNGHCDLVVMSIETYEELLETEAMDAAISEAEAELDWSGLLHDAKTALAALHRKHFR